MGAWLTPKGIAQDLGVDQGKVTAWIQAGELRAINVAQRQATRPRWRIRAADYEMFLTSRQTNQPTPPTPRATRRRDEAITTKYF